MQPYHSNPCKEMPKESHNLYVSRLTALSFLNVGISAHCVKHSAHNHNSTCSWCTSLMLACPHISYHPLPAPSVTLMIGFWLPLFPPNGCNIPCTMLCCHGPQEYPDQGNSTKPLPKFCIDAVMVALGSIIPTTITACTLSLHCYFWWYHRW